MGKTMVFSRYARSELRVACRPRPADERVVITDAPGEKVRSIREGPMVRDADGNTGARVFVMTIGAPKWCGDVGERARSLGGAARARVREWGTAASSSSTS